MHEEEVKYATKYFAWERQRKIRGWAYFFLFYMEICLEKLKKNYIGKNGEFWSWKYLGYYD